MEGGARPTIIFMTKGFDSPSSTCMTPSLESGRFRSRASSAPSTLTILRFAPFFAGQSSGTGSGGGPSPGAAEGDSASGATGAAGGSRWDSGNWIHSDGSSDAGR